MGLLPYDRKPTPAQEMPLMDPVQVNLMGAHRKFSSFLAVEANSVDTLKYGCTWVYNVCMDCALTCRYVEFYI